MTGAQPMPLETLRRVTAGLQPRDKALLTLLFRACARITEALSLRIGDVCLGDSPTAHFRRETRKGKRKGHRVRLHPEAQDALRAWVAVHPCPAPSSPLFPALSPNVEGLHPMSRVSAHRLLKTALEAAGEAGYSLHSLRKGGATHLVAATGQVRWAQDVLGHAHIATTEHYLAADSARAQAALATLD